MTPPVVFLGPTLPLADAKTVLPDAVYLPPARCGDVLRALRLLPRALLIIDGTYESTPAVWHKEIAIALERGIPVYGAASMGALRAAELADFGMIGIGGIFEDYRAGRLTDDDEVAVVQSVSGERLSTAMVDIRATVTRAVERGVLGVELANRILVVTKRMFYPDRCLETALESLDDCAELREFAAFVAEGGLVERKRADALDALRRLADPEWQRPVLREVRVPRTAPVRVLFREISCGIFHSEIRELPKPERVLQAARFLGAPYRDAKRLAELMSAVYELAPSGAVTTTNGWWREQMDSAEWATANDCTLSQQLALRERTGLCAGFEQFLLASPPEDQTWVGWRAATNHSRYLRWLDALDDTQDSQNPTRVRDLLARAWRVVDLAGRRARLVPAANVLQTLFQAIRMRRGLIEADQLQAWATRHRMSLHELGAMLVARFRWHALASEAHTTVIGIERADETIHWLLEAIRLSGLYPRARVLLEMDFASRNEVAVLPKNLTEAIERDFDSDDRVLLRRSLAACATQL